MKHKRPAKLQRNPTIDGLKYVAAAGIVLHHVAAGAGGHIGTFLTSVPLWALFLFFAISGYFHGALRRGASWLGHRAARLGSLYAIWSVVLLAIWQSGIMPGGRPPLPDFTNLLVLRNIVFFAGIHGILWTLPMLIYCAIIVEIFVRTPRSRRIMLAAMALLTLAIYWLGPIAAINASPLQNFLEGSRYVFVYIAGMEIRAGGGWRIPPRLLGWALPGSMIAAGLSHMGGGILPYPLWITVDTFFWTAGALILLKGADQGMEWFGVRRLAWGKDFLIGIYITHIVWLPLFATRVPPTSMPNFFWIPLTWTFCLTAATATVALLRSNRVTRFAVS